MRKFTPKEPKSLEDLAQLNTVLDYLYSEVFGLQAEFYKYFQKVTDPLIEEGKFEECFELLDTWDARNSEIHKFQLFRIIAEKEAKATGEEQRDYHERYKKDLEKSN